MGDVFNYTAVLQVSSDYKARFAAEYMLLDERTNRLEKAVEEALDAESDSEPGSPLPLLECQLGHMQAYREILKIRAEIEGVDLEAFERDLWEGEE